MPFHLEKGPWFSVVEEYLNSQTDDQLLDMLAELRAGRPLWEFGYVSAPTLEMGSNNPYAQRSVREEHMAVHWFGRTKVEAPAALSKMQSSSVQSSEAQAGTEAIATYPIEQPANFADAQRATDLRRAELLQALRAARKAVDAERAEAGGVPSTSDTLAESTFRGACREYVKEGLIASTGYWSGYYGQVEEIMRVSRIRAIEVSLGLEPMAIPAPSSNWIDVKDDLRTPKAEISRRLPIEYLWKCPQRWFEAWITWRYEPEDSNNPESNYEGHVTVLLCTPGAGAPVRDRFSDTPAAKSIRTSQTTGVRPSSCFSPSTDETLVTRGMWVVAHTDHDVIRPDDPFDRRQGPELFVDGDPQGPARLPTTPTAKGEWTIPHFGPCLVGLEGVATWAPTEADGGVLPHGRPFGLEEFHSLYPDNAGSA